MAPDLTAINMGWRHFVRVSEENESTYGTAPGSINWMDIPMKGGSFNLRQKSEHFLPDDNVAGWQGPRAIKARVVVSGGLSCLLYPTSINKMLKWALTRDANGQLYSKVVEYRNPLEQRRYLGVKVNTLTITGDAGSSDISLAFDLIGKSSADASATFSSDPTLTTQTAMKFQDALLYVPNTTDLLTCDSFTITVNNNLVPGAHYGTDGTIVSLKSAKQEVTIIIPVDYNDTTLAGYMRAGTTTSFKAIIEHPSIVTDGKLTLAASKLFVPEDPLEIPHDGVAKETITLTAEIPSSGNQLTATIANGSGS